jgi:hypothetical protein
MNTSATLLHNQDQHQCAMSTCCCQKAATHQGNRYHEQGLLCLHKRFTELLAQQPQSQETKACYALLVCVTSVLTSITSQQLHMPCAQSRMPLCTFVLCAGSTRMNLAGALAHVVAPEHLPETHRFYTSVSRARWRKPIPSSQNVNCTRTP